MEPTHPPKGGRNEQKKPETEEEMRDLAQIDEQFAEGEHGKIDRDAKLAKGGDSCG